MSVRLSTSVTFEFQTSYVPRSAATPCYVEEEVLRMILVGQMTILSHQRGIEMLYMYSHLILHS